MTSLLSNLVVQPYNWRLRASQNYAEPITARVTDPAKTVYKIDVLDPTRFFCLNNSKFFPVRKKKSQPLFVPESISKFHNSNGNALFGSKRGSLLMHYSFTTKSYCTQMLLKFESFTYYQSLKFPVDGKPNSIGSIFTCWIKKLPLNTWNFYCVSFKHSLFIPCSRATNIRLDVEKKHLKDGSIRSFVEEQ